MKISILVVAVCDVVLFVSCVGSSRLERQIGEAVQQKCQKVQPCELRLRDVTPFEWDRMFYFDYTVNERTRRDVVGTGLSTRELQRQLVFVRQGKVVVNELLPTDVEKPVRGEVAFAVGTKGWISCDIGAVFRATHDSFGSGVQFFELTPATSDNCR